MIPASYFMRDRTTTGTAVFKVGCREFYISVDSYGDFAAIGELLEAYAEVKERDALIKAKKEVIQAINGLLDE